MEQFEVGIQKLKVFCTLGCFPQEREAKTLIEVDLRFHLSDLPSEDAIDKTVDYVQVASVVKRTLEEGRFYLLEIALLALKEALFSSFSKVDALDLTIWKKDSLEGCESTFVHLKAKRVKGQTL
jgi:dihydroneopterin aldolase